MKTSLYILTLACSVFSYWLFFDVIKFSFPLYHSQPQMFVYLYFDKRNEWLIPSCHSERENAYSKCTLSDINKSRHLLLPKQLLCAQTPSPTGKTLIRWWPWGQVWFGGQKRHCHLPPDFVDFLSHITCIYVCVLHSFIHAKYAPWQLTYSAFWFSVSDHIQK